MTEKERVEMELDQLRYFLQVAKVGNFTRAAEELGISQPALSRSIQRLEEELGQPVLERQTRSVKLTDAGLLLRPRAEEMLLLVEATKAEITDDGQTGKIRIGSIPTIAPFFLPEVLGQFSKKYPRAVLQVQEEPTPQLLNSCEQGELDVAILALPVTSRHLEVQELFDEELFLVLPPNHPLASADRVVFDDLAAQPFVLLREMHCLSDAVVALCDQRSFQPVVVEKVNQLATVQELVSLGHGISMIPAMARSRDRSDTRIYRSLTDFRPTRTIAVVWNPYRFQSRLMQAFRESLVP